jgi:hypothetical protein
MSTRSTTWRARLGVAVAALGMALAGSFLPQQAQAVPPGGNAITDDRQTATPTAWRWYSGVSAAHLGSTAISGGYRITDLEVDSASPLTFSARLVHNSGAYAAPGGWWWYYGKTLAQVNSLLSTNQARLVDIEGYTTSAGTRYAVAMVRNTGTAARTWYYRVGTNATTMYNELVNKGFRPQQIGSYRVGSTKIYTLIALRNTGADARTWWWRINRTSAQVSSDLNTSQARLVNLDRVSSTTFDILQFKEPVSFWLWYTNLTFAQVNQVIPQTGTRLIDIERYNTAAGPRFAVVLLDNLDTADGKARSAMWKRYGSFKQWGFYLKRVNGATPSALQASKQFEPASAIKVLVHFHTNLKLQQGQANVNQVLNYKKSDRPDWWNSCPDNATIAGTQTLGVMDKEMMTQSNNPYTHSLRQRFGTANIEATGTSIGLTATKFNHNIGCGGPVANRTTLTDLGRIYEKVELGSPLGGTYRTRFLTNMNSSTGSSSSLCDVVKQEAASLGKPASFATTFCAGMRFYSKGGSYTLSGGTKWFTGAGLARLPVKTGTRSFVYGTYLQGITLNAGETEAQMDAPRTAALKEIFRPEIRAAIQTY